MQASRNDQLIKQYFVQDAPVTQSLITNLNELNALDIHPTLPNLSDSASVSVIL